MSIMSALTPASNQDIALLTEYIERVPRGLAGIAARCDCGKPLVMATLPLIDEKVPFPTTYYLAHPALVKATSRIEAIQTMPLLNAVIEADPQLQTALDRAHEQYLQARESIRISAGLPQVPQLAGITAGGLPSRVKCLHAMLGHALAAGEGVNPIGDWTLRVIEAASTAPMQACLCVRADATHALGHELPERFARGLEEGKLA